MKLEVCKKYVLMNGDVIEIIEKQLDNGVYPYFDNNNQWYSVNGSHISGSHDQCISHEYKDDETMNKLQLEVGKMYVNRRGKTVTIVEIDNNRKYHEVCYPYKGDNGYYYTEHGCFYVYDDGKSKDMNDLVKEYKDDETMNELKLEVGKKYVTRDGYIVTITEIDNNYMHNNVHYPYKGNNERRYTENGYFYVCDDSKYVDINALVKEYKEDETINEKRETIDKEYLAKCFDNLINDLEKDIILIKNTGGSASAVSAIKHCIDKINKVCLNLN